MSQTEGVLPQVPPTVTLAFGQGDTLCDMSPPVDGRPTGTYTFRGHRIEVRTPAGGEVFFPTDVGLSLLEALQPDGRVDLQDKRVLDIGSGSGIHTLAALTAGAESVTALDINPACADAVTANATLNSLPVERIDTRTAPLADLKTAGGWDLVVCNPPHFPDNNAYNTGGGVHTALVAGEDGRALYDEVLARIDDLLAPGGTMLLAHSSLTDIPRTRRELEARGYTVTTLLVCEMDIPMRAFADQRDLLLAGLYRLRSASRAAFTGLRFEVHTLAVTRTATGRTQR